MKKWWFLLGIVIIIELIFIGFIFFLNTENSNINNNEKIGSYDGKVSQEIQDYFNQGEIDQKEDKLYLVNDTIEMNDE
jgi:hypothetical protein